MAAKIHSEWFWIFRKEGNQWISAPDPNSSQGFTKKDILKVLRGLQRGEYIYSGNPAGADYRVFTLEYKETSIFQRVNWKVFDDSMVIQAVKDFIEEKIPTVEKFKDACWKKECKIEVEKLTFFDVEEARNRAKSAYNRYEWWRSLE